VYCRVTDSVGGRHEGGDEPASALELDVDLGADGLEELAVHLEGPVQSGGRNGERVILRVLVERGMHDGVDGGAVVPVHDPILFLEDDLNVVRGAHRDIHDETAPLGDGRFHGLDDVFFLHASFVIPVSFGRKESI
jgi:hypothetical protein